MRIGDLVEHHHDAIARDLVEARLFQRFRFENNALVNRIGAGEAVERLGIGLFDGESALGNLVRQSRRRILRREKLD